MRVEKYSLFFPPTIWSKTKGETEYAIGSIPAGGYVRISGMNPSDDLPEEVRDRAYHAQPVWKRMAVIAAGPAVNFVLAFLLLFVFYAAMGPRETTNSIETVQKGYPAFGKLKPGDKIVAVDGKGGQPADFSKRIQAHKCIGTAEKGCSAAPKYDPSAPGGPRTRLGFGFSADGPRHAFSASESFDITKDQFWFITRETAKLPAYIFDSKKRSEIQGIVGVSDTTHKAISRDTGDAVFLFAVISLSLAIINLFPFLPLDGGHIFWAAVEFVRRRPVPYAVMERAGVVGFMLVIGLFLLGLSNDIGRLTSGTNVP
jgi:regulator of sigma E protease